MRLRFYGTRGSIPTSGNSVKYGGNTTCLEVLTQSNEEYIFDAGSGLRELGNDLMKRGFAPGSNGKAKIFLSHLHWDHIQGLPFFVPAYIGSNDITVYGEKKDSKILKELLSGQMTSPYFPVPMDIQKGLKEFVELEPGRTVYNGIAVGNWKGNHPNGSLVYAIRELHNKIIFATDYEHDSTSDGKRVGEIDAELVKFAKGADILIYDGQYTPEEYQSKKGWGHSTYTAGIDIAVAANVKKIVLTHHDPSHSDTTLDDILLRASSYIKEKYSSAKLEIEMAYDGMEIILN